MRIYIHRIVQLLLFFNLCLGVKAKEKTGAFVLSGGCITTATQYLVNGGLPAAITATAAGGGSCTSYGYQWQQSADNMYFTDIPGATGQNLSFTATLSPSKATWFQRKTICGNETAYTGSISVVMIDRFYYNVKDSAVYTRNNCGTGSTPGTYKYVVPASKYSSPFNQADADAKAKKDLTDSGQYYANIRAVCTWRSVQKSGVYTRNNCATGGSPGTYTYIVSDKKYTSTISQPDADAKAQKELTDSGQVYANRLANCTWLSAPASGTYTKNNCTGSTTPSSVEYKVSGGKYSSTISQTDADAKAQKEVADSGQIYANRNGVCQNLFISMLSGAVDPGVFSVTVKNLSGAVLFSMTRDLHQTINYAFGVPAASGYIVEVASMSPMYTEVNGQPKLVNSAGASWNTGDIITIHVSKNERFYNDPQSITFFKSCPSGYMGSAVPYGVAANTYGSFVSKQEANQLALNQINTYGQTNANNNGTCTLIQNVTITLNNSFLRNELYGSTVSFYRSGVLAQTVTFPATETGTVPVTLPAGSYTMTFTVPNLGQPFKMSYKLQPTGTTWTQSSGQFTITTGVVTFAFGTSYTLTATTTN